MTNETPENPGNRDAVMKSMMEMMPMMMSHCSDQEFEEMQGMMAKMKGGGPDNQAPEKPEMMLTMMVPHCIGMMMPKVSADRRGEVASEILSMIISKGSDGMSGEQTQAFLKSLQEVLNRST